MTAMTFRTVWIVATREIQWQKLIAVSSGQLYSPLPTALKHQLQVWESSGPPSLQTCWLQIRGSPGTSLGLIIYWTDSQNSGKPYTCDYSFTVTKGYKLKPAKRRATQGKIWEEPKCEASGCLSLGSYGQCYLLLAKMYDNTRILPTREAYPGIWYLKFISWFNHMLPAWLTFSFQLLPEGRLTHLVSSSSGGRNWCGVFQRPPRKSCC